MATESGTAKLNDDKYINDNFSAVKQKAEALRDENPSEALEFLENISEYPRATRSAEDNMWLYGTLGFLYEQADRDDQALQAYRTAFEYEPRNRDILGSMAKLLIRRDNRQEAIDVLKMLVLFYHDEVSDDRMAWIHRKLGEFYEKQQKLEKARYSFEKAIQASSESTEALNGLLRVAEQIGDTTEIVDIKHQLLNTETDVDTRVETLLSLGDDWRIKLNDRRRALQAYEEALIEAADHPTVLQRIVQVSEKLELWTRLVQAARRLADIEQNAARSADWYLKAAQVSREKLWQPEAALEDLRRALDRDPTRLDALQMASSILIDSRDWEALEALYNVLIEANRSQSSSNSDLLFELHYQLAETYQTHLDSPQKALDTLLEAEDVKPDAPKLHRKIVALAQQLDNDEVLSEHIRKQQSFDTENTDLMAEIGDFFRENGDPDAAFPFYHARAFVGESISSEAKQTVEDISSPYAVAPAEPLTPQLFEQYIFPNNLDKDVTRLSKLAKQALGENLGETPSALGLSEDDRVDRDDSRAFSQLVRTISTALDCPEPVPVWHDPDRDGLALERTTPPGLVVDEDWLSMSKQKQLAFGIGRKIALTLDPFYLAAIYSPESLTGLFSGIAELANGADGGATSLSSEVEQILRENLPLDEVGEILEQSSIQLVPGQMKRWIEAVEQTANRTGLLFSADLEAVRQVLESDPSSPAGTSADEQFKRIMEYFLSGPYYELKQTIPFESVR